MCERDRWTCQICGNAVITDPTNTVELRSPTIDHNVSLARGGRHRWNNVQLACRECNAIKRQRVRATWGLPGLIQDPITGVQRKAFVSEVRTPHFTRERPTDI